MNLDRINEIAFKTMGNRKSHLYREKGFIYYHCQRVAKLAINLRKELFSEQGSIDDIIYVGALFHDVAKGIEPHNETGAQLVKSLLRDELPPENLELVSDIIARHNTRDRNELPFYIKIVQDADILDHFGTLEIWLKIMYSAHAEENVFDAISLWDSEDYMKYLESSRSALNYAKSQEIFDMKIQFEKQFQDRFKLECKGEIHY
ncbi:HD domain-containing protein [Paenibacillus sp. M1]|uniref:HD domain-containing protein n=1 Tax=Paenibacillus haidiansis TaxID=1574488 RepID=A0ABU7VQT7_9BACL